MAELEPRGLRFADGQSRDVGQRGRHGEQEVRGDGWRIAQREHLVQRHAVEERPDPQPPQGRDVPDRAAGAREVAGEGAHVHALAGLHLKLRLVRRGARDELEAVHPRRPRLDHHLLPLARKVVGALATELDRRVGGRHLQDVAGERGQRGADRLVRRPRVAHRRHLPVAVVGVARLPEAQGEAVHLRAVHHIGHGLRRSPERDGQQPRRERVEGAAMADLLRIEQTLEGGDDVGAAHAGGLVHDQPSVERAALGLAVLAPARRRRGCLLGLLRGVRLVCGHGARRLAQDRPGRNRSARESSAWPGGNRGSGKRPAFHPQPIPRPRPPHAGPASRAPRASARRRRPRR